jgi:hypothetical protein
MSVNFQNCRLISRIVVARNRAAERATAADFFPEIIAVSVCRQTAYKFSVKFAASVSLRA